MKYIIKAFVKHILKTYKNKLAALVMIAAGLLVAALTDDATFLVFVTTFGIPLFITKEDCFYNSEAESLDR